MDYILLSYIIFAVALGSSGDGLNNRGIQTWGHLLKAIEIAALLWLPFIFGLSAINEGAALFASYICIRVGLFDYIRNVTAGQSLWYMSGTNWWDKLMSKVPPHGLMFDRIIFMIAGVWVIYRYL